MSGDASERGAAAAATIASGDPWVGRVVAGRYRVLDFLAAGGMGRIYRAEQEPLGRVVALKVLNPRYTASGDDPEFQKRFLLEAATYAKLHHPNVVTIFDYGRVDAEDTYYMAMEFVVGRTLSQVLRTEGPLPAARVVQIARQIGRALREAHRLGIVHRDLKPSNVMLLHTDEGESVKVLDFGLVKVLRDDSEDLTMEGKFLGSPKYMSPEQIRHQPVDARSDLYSLGIIMFELLTGKVPFEGAQAVQTLMMHVSQPAPSLRERNTHVPLELEAVVQRCLMKEPDQRYADVEQFMNALRLASTGLREEPSFDPLRSSTGSWTSLGASDAMAAPVLTGSSGSHPSFGSYPGSGAQPASSSQPGSYPGSEPGSYPGSGSQPGSYPGSGGQPGSGTHSAPQDGSGGVTVTRPAELPRSHPPSVSPPRSSRALGPIIVGGAIIVAAAVLGVLLSRRGSDADRPSTAAAPPTAAPAAPVEPARLPAGEPGSEAHAAGPSALPAPPQPVVAPAPPAPAPAIVLHLRAEPDADVYEGDTRLGSTPLEVPLDPAAALTRTFALRRAGFRSEEIEVAPTTASVERTVRLRRAGGSASVRPSRPPGPGPSPPPIERPRSNPDLDIRTSR